MDIEIVVLTPKMGELELKATVAVTVDPGAGAELLKEILTCPVTAAGAFDGKAPNSSPAIRGNEKSHRQTRAEPIFFLILSSCPGPDSPSINTAEYPVCQTGKGVLIPNQKYL